MKTPKIVAAIAILLLLLIGSIHFIDTRESYGDAAYKGVLFFAIGLGSLVAAIGIARGAKTWGWGLGLVIAVSAFLGYLASRTIGLPMLPAEPDAWFEPLGIASFVAEGIFSLLALRVLSKSSASPAKVASGSHFSGS